VLLVGVPTVSCFVGFRVRHRSFRFPFPFRSLVAACAPRIYDEGHSVVPIEAFPIVASPSPAYRAARQGPSKPSKVRSTRTYHRKEGGTRKRSYQRLLPSEAERRHRSVPFPLLGLRNARRNPKGRQGALPLRMPRGFGTERLRTVSGARAFPTPGTYRGSSEGIGREGRQWAFESLRYEAPEHTTVREVEEGTVRSSTSFVACSGLRDLCPVSTAWCFVGLWKDRDACFDRLVRDSRSCFPGRSVSLPVV
jgi:hypothetical protein